MLFKDVVQTAILCKLNNYEKFYFRASVNRPFDPTRSAVMHQLPNETIISKLEYPINAERCVQHLLSERLRLSA